MLAEIPQDPLCIPLTTSAWLSTEGDLQASCCRSRVPVDSPAVVVVVTGAESAKTRASRCVDAGLPVRLVNGGDRCQGWVEVLYQGYWGTVCDDSWDTQDADVVCRQLGCGHSVSALGGAHFGQGSGNILLGAVYCSGGEPYLSSCRHDGWYNHECGHREDAGVVCSGRATISAPQPPQGLAPVRVCTRVGGLACVCVHVSASRPSTTLPTEGVSLLCSVPCGSHPSMLTSGQPQVLDLGLQSPKSQVQTCSDRILTHALSLSPYQATLEIMILQTVGIRGPFVPLGAPQ
ncbi:Hypothetical predicted protein [Marmota monax]|uniref:SRCR domain-containing protein n=1 Tax=Marmota monax TaxID=9995 RepID=A0A5E4BYR2_MARMO|nr:Hypothetical predicted protein [Marmota monax]